jgi:integrase
VSVRKRKWTTSKGEEKEAWIVAYSQDGRRHIETFKRKKDADAKAQQVGVDIRAGTHTPASRSITVRQAADDWIKTAEVEGREALTIAQYRQHANHIAQRIGPVRLANLTATQVNAFRDDLLATMSKALARKVMTSLKSLLKDAWRRGKVAQNVALSAKRIDPDGRGKEKLKIGVDIPSTDEIRALIAALPDRWRPLFLTAIFAGLRASELRGLRWQDVDFQKKELHVRQRIDRRNGIGPPKSDAGRRTVPLGPMVLNTLRAWRPRCPPGALGLVFPSGKGGICGYHPTIHALLAAGHEAGLLDANGEPKYTGLHALRHFYASWCINSIESGGQGLPAKAVQERLGHSSIVMTMDTYGHLFPRSADAEKRLAEAERKLMLG